jgi:hypothetical protein
MEINGLIEGDFSHCCPHGYTCNVEEDKCEKGISIPWFTKNPTSRFNLPAKFLRSYPSLLSTIQCPMVWFFYSKEKFLSFVVKMANPFVRKIPLVVN